jgi:hypothetical protein
LAGYVKLPAWWVTQEQLLLIEYMCRGNLEEINRIKNEAEACQPRWQSDS